MTPAARAPAATHWVAKAASLALVGSMAATWAIAAWLRMSRASLVSMIGAAG
jgi:hypothetical protein